MHKRTTFIYTSCFHFDLKPTLLSTLQLKPIARALYYNDRHLPPCSVCCVATNWAKHARAKTVLGPACLRYSRPKKSYGRKKFLYKTNFPLIFRQKQTTFIYTSCFNSNLEPALFNMYYLFICSCYLFRRFCLSGIFCCVVFFLDGV